MKAILTALALLTATPLYAGSLTISIASTPITGSKAYVISDADATKLLAFVQAAYPTRANPAFVPSCVAPAVCAPATLPNNAAQSLAAWADGIVAGTTANVQSYQRGIAHDAAVAGIAPIDIK